MEADDLVNLVAGGRGRSKQFLRPLLQKLTGQLLGDTGDDHETGNSPGNSKRGRLSGSGLLNLVSNFFSRDHDEPRIGEAEEVREEADNELTVNEESNGCCRQLLAGYKMHVLLFLFTFALTLNWSATAYAITRKVCLAQNISAHESTAPEELCKRWLRSDKSGSKGSEVYSVEDMIKGLFEIQDVPDYQALSSTSSSAITNLPNANTSTTHLNQQLIHTGRKSHGRKAAETVELYATYQAIVALVPPALVMIVVILSYRDEFTNFRTPLLIGMFGTALSTAANLASSRFPDAPLFYDTITPCGEMLCGGLPLIIMCIYVHVACSVPSNGHTVAFFLLQISFTTSFITARLVSALVVEAYTETLSLFIVSMIVILLTLIFAYVFVDHVKFEKDTDQPIPRRRHARVNGRHHSSTDPVLLSSRLFSHHHLLRSVRGLVHDQAQGTKYEMLFVMATIFFFVATTNGFVACFLFENTNQSEVIRDSSIIIAILLIVIPFFVIIVRKLPFDPNYTLTFIGVFSLTASQTFHFASLDGGQNSAVINRIQHVLRTLLSLAPAGMRAHAAKLVERQKFGKIFGMVAACEALVPFIGVAMRKIIGGGFSQLPFLLLMWGTLLMLGVGQCRRRKPQVAVEAVDEDE